jgi:hypothetical protein
MIITPKGIISPFHWLVCDSYGLSSKGCHLTFDRIWVGPDSPFPFFNLQLTFFSFLQFLISSLPFSLSLFFFLKKKTRHTGTNGNYPFVHEEKRKREGVISTFPPPLFPFTRSPALLYARLPPFFKRREREREEGERRELRNRKITKKESFWSSNEKGVSTSSFKSDDALCGMVPSAFYVL